MPKISVIIPVYNVEDLLSRCLDSIVNQTFTDFELILIDDGSKDHSGQICDGYAMKDSRVIVKHIPNGGQSAARNLGIDLAKGEFITFIDSDDFATLEYLEKLYGMVEEHQVDVASCSYISYSEARHEQVKKAEEVKNTMKVHVFDNNHDIMKDFLEKEFKDNRNFPWEAYANLYKAELLDGIRFEVGREFEDNFFNYQYFVRVKKAAAIEYIGYYYYVNPKSKTRIPFYVEQFDLIQQERLIVEGVKKDYPDLLNYESNNLALKYCWLYGKIFGDIELKNLKASRPHIKNIKKLYNEDKIYFGNLDIGKKWQFFLTVAGRFPWVTGIANRLYRMVKGE
ncbi:MAG: glycosyltransferase family 2 protein [Streptococcaceae bacterium]|nr:glycosyltransferase family 2 protein [Streptococcaceae bacterium]MCL2680967.1 glycosyltransferase family 2 protein [Streptococcaceae bacterium]